MNLIILIKNDNILICDAARCPDVLITLTVEQARQLANVLLQCAADMERDFRTYAELRMKE